MGLYKGLGAVLGGIIPKMAIRFTSYESYKQMLADKETGAVTSKATFLGKSRILESRPVMDREANEALLFSWSCCWCDRSRGSGQSHGGC